jgi:hypothetical protein
MNVEIEVEVEVIVQPGSSVPIKTIHIVSYIDGIDVYSRIR